MLGRKENIMLEPVLDRGYVKLVDRMGTDLSVVNAARVSYDKESEIFSERDRKLLKYLIRHDHTSPFRHATITFEAYAPLLVARQWWKYAVASSHLDDQNGWNESSRRYVTEDEEYYTPGVNGWREAPDNKKQGSGNQFYAPGWTAKLQEYQRTGQELYEAAMADGIAPEQARLFLPAYGLYVRWRWTTSLQGTLHFLAQRLHHTSQWEIQQYAKAVNNIMTTIFPETMESWFEENQ